MDDIYKNVEEHNLNKKWKILIVSNDMIADMLHNKKLNPIVTKLFVRGRKLKIYPTFMKKILFSCTKDTRLNSTQCFIMKIPNKWELQQNPFNNLLYIDCKDFMNLYKHVLENHILF